MPPPPLRHTFPPPSHASSSSTSHHMTSIQLECLRRVWSVGGGRERKREKGRTQGEIRKEGGGMGEVEEDGM
eukprot:666270-Rhodomonas_salina.1